MRHPTRPLGRALFGAAVLAALGFGTAQALAASAGAPQAGTARTCTYADCNYSCISEGNWGGSCIHDPSGGTRCVCIY